jgi:hypothetical protein
VKIDPSGVVGMEGGTKTALWAMGSSGKLGARGKKG